MTEASSKTKRTRDLLLLALSFAAGYVDAAAAARPKYTTHTAPSSMPLTCG